MADRERLTRQEAVDILTMQRDLMEDARKAGLAEEVLHILEVTGDRVGYTPAFRCLVKGLEPEQSVRWRD